MLFATFSILLLLTSIQVYTLPTTKGPGKLPHEEKGKGVLGEQDTKNSSPSPTTSNEIAEISHRRFQAVKSQGDASSSRSKHTKETVVEKQLGTIQQSPTFARSHPLYRRPIMRPSQLKSLTQANALLLPSHASTSYSRRSYGNFKVSSTPVFTKRKRFSNKWHHLTGKRVVFRGASMHDEGDAVAKSSERSLQSTLPEKHKEWKQEDEEEFEQFENILARIHQERNTWMKKKSATSLKPPTKLHFALQDFAAGSSSSKPIKDLPRREPSTTSSESSKDEQGNHNHPPR
jgi:hypothetical protein